jgi:hypothetical protein
MPPALSDSRKITRPHSKLNRLCAEAAARGSELRTYAAVAEAITVTPGRITQMFGYGQEAEGYIVEAKTVGAIVKAFRDDGVPCQVDWFYLEFEAFAAKVAVAQAEAAKPTEAVVWELREETVLTDLVELRIDPPTPDNEIPDAYRVNGTLLFGTARCEYEPDGPNPRTVGIALRDARFAIAASGYQPLAGTMVGEREGTQDSPNYERAAGGIAITGPAVGGALNGRPLGDHHFATIAAANVGDAVFRVSVMAEGRSFIVADPDAAATPAPNDNRAAILSFFIYSRCDRDEQQRAIVARATARRRPGNEPAA